VIENAASPAETVTFSAAATVVVIVSTAVSLVTENPNAFAPEEANATAPEEANATAPVVVEWFVTGTAASVATMSGTTELHMRQRNPIAAQISD